MNGIRTRYDFDRQWTEVYVPSIIAVAEEVTGSKGGHLEMTGGNCAAVEIPLEGAVLAIVDSDVFTYSDGDWQVFMDGWTVVIHTIDADGCWSDEPVTVQSANDGPDGDSLRTVIHDALRSV